MTDPFGVQPFTSNDLEKLFFVPAHFRSLLHYHRGLENADFSKETYVYTGRGPSRAEFHIGHLPGLQLCLVLQRYFGTPIEFMIADDEKIFRDGISSDSMADIVKETLTTLDTIGYTKDNTNFRINSKGFTETEYIMLISIMRVVSVKTLGKIFGEKGNIGEYFYPLIQILPCLSKRRQCIVVAGLDQDPFFRLARDVAQRLGYKMPIVIYTSNVPGLDGSNKMSTSIISSMPIFLNDRPSVIAEKVNKIKKVGAGTLEELLSVGAKLEEDIPYRLISIFDSCSENVALIAKAYTVGLNDPLEIERLNSLVPAKGIRTKQDSCCMMTTFGVRAYLTQLLTTSLASYRRE